jgi:hypothetical protein
VPSFEMWREALGRTTTSSALRPRKEAARFGARSSAHARPTEGTSSSAKEHDAELTEAEVFDVREAWRAVVVGDVVELRIGSLLLHASTPISSTAAPPCLYRSAARNFTSFACSRNVLNGRRPLGQLRPRRQPPRRDARPPRRRS